MKCFLSSDKVFQDNVFEIYLRKILNFVFQMTLQKNVSEF